MSVCIPTYMLAGIMNWWQALLTIGIGNLIVLIPLILNAHPGTKYGIPFHVLARSSFGINGSNIPALLRALVACGSNCRTYRTINSGVKNTLRLFVVHRFLHCILPLPDTDDKNQNKQIDCI